MDGNAFDRWFDQTSGYAPHAARIRKLPECCMPGLEDTGRTVLLPFANGGEPMRCPLLVCPRCGGMYAKLEEGYVTIENFLKYRVE